MNTNRHTETSGMIKMYLIFLICFVRLTHGEPKDYEPLFERLKLVYYEKRLIGPNPEFSIKKYNRTNYVLNAGFDLLQDLDGREIWSATRGYVFLSNRYRYTGIQFKMNACEMWEKNLYGITDIMKTYGNIEFCDIKKGHLYISNFWPNTKYFPKSIPTGSYKVEYLVDFTNGTKLLQYNWYGKASLYFKEMNSTTQSL